MVYRLLWEFRRKMAFKHRIDYTASGLIYTFESVIK
jgi:hypothetical protein